MSRVPLRNGLVDPEDRFAEVDGIRVELTPLEARFVGRIASSPRSVIPYATLLLDVWEANPRIQTRAIEALVSRLRKKLGEDARHPAHIRTVHGEGIWFEPHQAPVPDLRSVRPTFGRQPLIDRVGSLWGPPGLVVLVGPAGVGKTWLAHACLPPGGTFVDLATVEDVDGMVAAIALRIGLSDERATREGVLRAVERGGALVLDNFEQLDAECARFAGALAETRAVLVTSQRTLRVPGERVVRIPPLDRTSARELLRTRVVEADGHVSDAELTEVVERLDGLPLEIELVAPVLALMGARGLHELPLLDLPAADDRAYGSLRAALSRSWTLLPPEDRALLGAWTHFRAAFDLDAAATVAGVTPIDALAAAQRLVQRSWLTAVGGGSFRMLVTVRAFAADRAAQEARSALPAWLTFCADLERRSSRDGPDAVAPHRDDLLAALDLADGEQLMDAALALVDLVHRRGGRARARDALERAMRRTRGPVYDLLLGLDTELWLPAMGDATELTKRLAQLERLVAEGSREPRIHRCLEVRRGAAGWVGRTLEFAGQPGRRDRWRIAHMLLPLLPSLDAALALAEQLAREQRALGARFAAEELEMLVARLRLQSGDADTALQQFERRSVASLIEHGAGLDMALALVVKGHPGRALAVLEQLQEAVRAADQRVLGQVVDAVRAVVLGATGHPTASDALRQGLELPTSVPIASVLAALDPELARKGPLADGPLEEVRRRFVDEGVVERCPDRAYSAGWLVWVLRQVLRGAPAAL